MNSEHVVSIEDVRAAHKTIGPHVHRTPVATSSILDELTGARLFFKCENLQKIGAFKFRGACNAVLRLSNDDAKKGVVTHSSGNHAQALAMAAKMRNIQAWIVMPRTASQVKLDAVRGYGANIILCEPTLESRSTTTIDVQKETGATFVHPFNHPHIIAGQGTAALELTDEIPNLDTLIAPVGGGGLISGTCAVANGLNESASTQMQVIGAEPSGADDAARSKAAGELVPQTEPNTIADGLLTSLGDLTWPYIRDVVSEVSTVSDEEIISAMRLFWERTKLVIEPSSATVIAVALKKKWPVGSRIGLILSGGNVDLGKLPWN